MCLVKIKSVKVRGSSHKMFSKLDIKADISLILVNQMLETQLFAVIKTQH